MLVSISGSLVGDRFKRKTAKEQKFRAGSVNTSNIFRWKPTGSLLEGSSLRLLVKGRLAGGLMVGSLIIRLCKAV